MINYKITETKTIKSIILNSLWRTFVFGVFLYLIFTYHLDTLIQLLNMVKVQNNPMKLVLILLPIYLILILSIEFGLFVLKCDSKKETKQKKKKKK